MVLCRKAFSINSSFCKSSKGWLTQRHRVHRENLYSGEKAFSPNAVNAVSPRDAEIAEKDVKFKNLTLICLDFPCVPCGSLVRQSWSEGVIEGGSERSERARDKILSGIWNLESGIWNRGPHA
jgi:hypothetical protein